MTHLPSTCNTKTLAAAHVADHIFGLTPAAREAVLDTLFNLLGVNLLNKMSVWESPARFQNFLVTDVMGAGSFVYIALRASPPPPVNGVAQEVDFDLHAILSNPDTISAVQARRDALGAVYLPTLPATLRARASKAIFGFGHAGHVPPPLAQPPIPHACACACQCST